LTGKGKLTKKKTSGRKGKKKNNPGNWFLAILIAFIILLIIKAIVAEPYIVRSTNMGQTVIPGELILINKTGYGARLPGTLLSIPFFGLNYYSTLIELPYFRLAGSDKINRFEIVLFNLPYQKEKPVDKRTQKISRIIGMPGDTLEIVNSKIKINDLYTDIPEDKLYFGYTVISANPEKMSGIFDKYDINEGSMNEKEQYIISTSISNYENLKNEKDVRKIYRTDISAYNENLVFPGEKSYHWSMNSFGPLVVPGKNRSVFLTKNNIAVYKDIIENFENCNLKITSSSISINGKKVSEYTFKYNYYFVLDDNRENANDSRYWGFLPENCIIGRCSTVLYSIDKSKKDIHKIQLSRFFKRIE